jgi:hypothetical protein
MSLREFYKSHYELELARKADLTAALALPVGVLSLLVGALVVVAKELHAPFSLVESIVCAAAGLSAVASLVSTYFLIRTLYNFAYGYVATPLEIQTYQSSLTAFHTGNGHPVEEAKQLAEEETLEYVDTEYAKYADRNAKNNDIKSTFLHRANGAIIAALLFGSLAGGAYVFKSISSPEQVPKVEVVNLKEVSRMPTPQPLQAATAPPPPSPSPPPAVRPQPPPGRIVREDHQPPRPPSPPKR